MAQHPTEEILNITRKFLGGEVGAPGQPPGGRDIPSGPGHPSLFGGSRLPPQASPVARSRAFGRQGARQRRRPGGDLIEPFPIGPSTPPVVPGTRSGSLSDDFFDLPGPVSFSRTPQGRAILQRILSLRGLR